MKNRTLVSLAALSCLMACPAPEPAPIDVGSTISKPSPDPPTAAAAKAFVAAADAGFRENWVHTERAGWAYATNITPETEAASAAADEQLMAFVSQTVAQARTYDAVDGIDEDTARKLHLIKIATSLPAPNDDAKRAELAKLAAELTGMYGKGKHCNEAGECRDLGDLEKVLATNRDYDAQLEAWTAWRTISPPMRDKYARFAELGNEGAKELGFDDLGGLWRSGYDMTPAEVEVEADRLWGQVEPLYKELHCHVRAKLAETYGEDKVPVGGPIPAHLTGNMWSQSWENLYPILEPHPGQPSLDVTKALGEKGYDEIKMVKSAEGFFTSLGMDPLPQTFWERSMFTKPEGKDVVCHASAWDVEMNDDLRIKMCIKVDMEDLITLHHELGHNYYYHYYTDKAALFQQGAHDGFHEGIGDTLALSITPSYLNKIGLLDSVSESDEAVLNKQMLDALQKISFLPFGRMIDQWRWDVFSGKATPANYNARWWELRNKYQGIAPPTARTEADFDPGAKYHIPGNTPYLRYFFAHVLQFQFHKALCEEAGHEGPLHTCSIYGSTKAGDKLKAMLAMGASKPWPDAMEAITGTRQMDAGALREYFQPLEGYLKEQNKGRTCGW
ncbi:MAG: M2 family metallopeptidase [Myxococcota bacterium]